MLYMKEVNFTVGTVEALCSGYKFQTSENVRELCKAFFAFLQLTERI